VADSAPQPGLHSELKERGRTQPHQCCALAKSVHPLLPACDLHLRPVLPLCFQSGHSGCTEQQETRCAASAEDSSCQALIAPTAPGEAPTDWLWVWVLRMPPCFQWSRCSEPPHWSAFWCWNSPWRTPS